MYIIREVFTAQPGKASKLATLFKKITTPEMKGRVMTDMVGAYNTVVMEVEVESLAEWEKQMKEMQAGKPDPNMDAATLEEMSHYHELFQGGHREIFKVVD